MSDAGGANERHGGLGRPERSEGVSDAGGANQRHGGLGRPERSEGVSDAGGAKPKVSVVIAAYRPGDAVRRVIDSLDAQTLPQDEFEVIFVDDGSGDGTYEQLQGFAATRPNMQVHTIPNSGWPSRPRNVGIGHARGEYVLFMDHDDSLFPDGLRRSYEYAHETGADLLSPKESKTNDLWWGLGMLVDGNVDNALVDGGIDRLLPMVPHKLYRRQLMIDHDVRFPEGARILWEDIYINIGVYRHAKVVSVLADTPVYLWHASDSNSSHSFDPARTDFWDRLEDVMDFAATTLDGPDHRDARAAALAHQIRVRVIDRLVRMLTKASTATIEMAFPRARSLLARYASDDVYALLAKKHAAQAYLLRAGRADLMVEFHQTDLLQRAQVDVADAAWRDGLLHLDLDYSWGPKAAAKPILRRDGDRVVRTVSDELARAIPPELLDVTEDGATMRFDLCIRGRSGYVSWNVPVSTIDGAYVDDDAGTVRVTGRGEATLDVATGAVGAPLADDVWDFYIKSSWGGMARRGAPLYTGPARPVLRDGRPGVAYANGSGSLSVDLAQRLRTFALDAKPADGPAGPITAFSTPLQNIVVHGPGALDADTVAAVPDAEVPDNVADAAGQRVLADLARTGALGARVVVDGDDARLEGGATLPAGQYGLFAKREGKWHPTNRSLVVADDGQATLGRR